MDEQRYLELVADECLEHLLFAMIDAGMSDASMTAPDGWEIQVKVGKWPIQPPTEPRPDGKSDPY